MLDTNILNTNSRFRYYSRQVLQHPTEIAAHHHRITIAHTMTATEPLQGALADLFYGCWYEMPIIGPRVLEKAQERLQTNVYQAFKSFTLKQGYINQVSPLATRWSVLVSPSLNVATHSVRTSSDDARKLADDIVNKLLSSKEEQRYDAIEEIETNFLEHCLVCNDLIAFTIVWFKLGKAGWVFDNRWQQCQEHLEELSKNT